MDNFHIRLFGILTAAAAQTFFVFVFSRTCLRGLLMRFVTHAKVDRFGFGSRSQVVQTRFQTRFPSVKVHRRELFKSGDSRNSSSDCDWSMNGARAMACSMTNRCFVSQADRNRFRRSSGTSPSSTESESLPSARCSAVCVHDRSTGRARMASTNANGSRAKSLPELVRLWYNMLGGQ